MYIYIYDSFVNESKNHKIIASIETRLTDLGLNGKIYRLGVIKSITSLLDEEIKKGAKTIIGVGNDFLFSQIINSVIKISEDSSIVPIIGFIPIGKNNDIANYFGINLSNAHAVISARRVKSFPLGKVNNNYFLSNVKISTKKTIIDINDRYQISLNEKNEAFVINLPISPKMENIGLDYEKLKLFIKNNSSGYFSNKSQTDSLISFQTIKVFDSNNTALIDNNYYLKSPFEISQSSKKINIIIAKDKKIIE